MFTNASKYAIRATLYLATNTKDGSKHSSVNIAKALDLSPAFIAKLLQQLAKENLISSTKGPNGGFYLTKKNSKQNVLKIIQLIDGDDVFDKCLLGLPVCGHAKPCPVHHIFFPFKQNMLEEFQQKTIDQLANEVEENGLFLSLK